MTAHLYIALAIVALGFADFFVTRYLLTLPRFAELNPFMRWAIYNFGDEWWLPKGALHLASAMPVALFPHPAVTGVGLAVVAAYVAALVWNYQQYRSRVS